MTVGAGVDLNQWTLATIQSWPNIDSDTISKISPYVSGNNLVGSAAQAALDANGGLSLDANNQAQYLTDGAYSETYNQLASAYNSATTFSTFQQLPAGVQTAIFDTALNSGLGKLQSWDLWSQITSGDWQAAYNNLSTWSGGGAAADDRRQADGAQMRNDVEGGQIPSPSSPCQ